MLMCVCFFVCSGVIKNGAKRPLDAFLYTRCAKLQTTSSVETGMGWYRVLALHV